MLVSFNHGLCLHLFVWPLRNDKYSSKVFRYFVEYSDKESTKRVRTESERQTSTVEA